MNFFLRSVLFCLLSVALSASADFSFLAAQQTEFLPVEQAYQLDVAVAEDKLLLNWQATRDYYLYRHGFKLAWLDAQGEAQAVVLTLPEGIEIHDEFFGETQVYYGQVAFFADLPDKPMILKASSQGCADAGLCYPPYDLYFKINPQDGTIKAIERPDFKVISDVQSQAYPALWLMLLSAFLGGLILNLMPCVFPVLSIKLLQLTQTQTASAQRKQALIYTFGILTSFVLVALLLLALRSAGSAIGWGFQLQNPWFVALLVYLFFVIALAMAGFIQLGQSVMGLGQGLTQGTGNRSAFFTGVLAVVVASPCTAPFMGAALGFAIAQPVWLAMLVFVALGLGMAAPLALLCFFPQWQRLLPKPGAWMERLRQFFAFPLMLTAVWLLWVLDNQVGSTAAAGVLVGCVLIAFALWAWQGRIFARAMALLALIAVIFLLPFQAPLAQKNASLSSGEVVYSAQALADLRASGQPVFVNLTADWCITCLANEKTTLHTQDVQQAFADAGVVYMVGDWTNYNAEITALLAQYQRNGIPLYLLYPANKKQPAIILPQILSKAVVLQAIKSM